jgi:hypothetical protein
MSEQSPDRPPTTVRTACHLCGSSGTIHEEKMAVRRGEVFSALTVRRCPVCSDWDTPGWMPGLQPPV